MAPSYTTQKEVANESLMGDIQGVYDKYEYIYGYRRIYIRIKLGKK